MTVRTTHPTTGFRLCSGCQRTFRPPYGRGWSTAEDGTWRCPECWVQPTCWVEGCERPQRSSGYCTAHYEHFRKTDSFPELVCSRCSSPLREPARLCGLCIAEERAA